MTTSQTTATPAATPTATPAASTRRTTAVNLLLDNIVWLLLVVFAIAAGLLNPFFLSIANLQNILVQAPTLGFLALAVSLALRLGEIGLSVVGVLGFSGSIGAILLEHGAPGFLAILACLAVGGLIGVINGVRVAQTPDELADHHPGHRPHPRWRRPRRLRRRPAHPTPRDLNTRRRGAPGAFLEPRPPVGRGPRGGVRPGPGASAGRARG